MGRYIDNSDVPHTCPKIDEVISAIESVDWSENSWWDAKRLIEIMEGIRSSNLKLRGWGNEMCRERDEYERQADSLAKEIKNLEQHVEYYKNQVE
jgi:hypothetical protein